MIKVLVINTVRFKLNGISAVIKNYYQAMNKKGLIIDFLAIDTPCTEYQSFFKDNHCKCHVLNKRDILKYFFGIVKVCKNEKYDMVHIHGNSANMTVELMAVLLGGVRHRITHSHNTSTLHPMAHKVLMPLFSALCTNRLACGEEAGKWLYKSKSFTILKNGIELSKYDVSQSIRNQYRKQLNIGSDEIVIGHVGNFIEQKNHNYLIDIFREIYDFGIKAKLLLISDGMLMPAIKKKVRDFGLENYVIFLGKTMEVENYLQAMDIFLLPSLHEGLPVVLIEAQAAGLPCIVSDTVPKEVDLTDTCKFLPISSKAIKEWAKETDRIYSVSQNRNRAEVSEANRKKIRECGYDITQNADVLRQIYMDII